MRIFNLPTLVVLFVLSFVLSAAYASISIDFEAIQQETYDRSMEVGKLQNPQSEYAGIHAGTKLYYSIIRGK